MSIKQELLNLKDEEYKKFHAKLMPTVNPDTIIGIRTPVLRAYAKNVKDTGDFLSQLPHEYYEENNLHAFLIERISDFDECIRELDRFLPFVDNWATCDMMRPKVFKKNCDKLILKVKEWLKSTHTYTVRFAIGMLMVHFSDENFKEEYLEWAASVKSDEYYVNMMLAWYFATALTKQYDSAIKYIEKNKLSLWVHNKTIQKAVESYRISDEVKDYLKTYRRKQPQK